MWAALGVMIVIWIVMNQIGGKYLTAVDAITDHAIKNKADESFHTLFRL